MHLKPIWFDSLGAKSSCVLVQTDVSILIDPGVAVMHASFPASSEEKRAWYQEALEKIRKAVKAADIIVITHYHHDHYLRERIIYENKILLVKNPNEYINDSQRVRAENFFTMLYGDVKFEDPCEKDYPLDELQLAKDFGDYQKRREELLKAGKKWFEERVRKWKTYKRIPESEKIIFCDGREFKFGKTRIRFSKPLFHGIEFSRLGWVCAVIIEFEGKNSSTHRMLVDP